MIEILFVPRNDERIDRLVLKLEHSIFERDRASAVFHLLEQEDAETAVLLLIDEREAGVAMLSSRNIRGEQKPSILSFWIDPELKTQPQIILHFFTKAVNYVQKTWGMPEFWAITPTQKEVALMAQKAGVQFSLVDEFSTKTDF